MGKLKISESCHLVFHFYFSIFHYQEISHERLYRHQQQSRPGGYAGQGNWKSCFYR